MQLHKKGDPTLLDNYRAIAVGSCMGKLFSSILLDRLLFFKEMHCPDPKEQLGFKKGAQTNDHVLTLKTVIDKYTKKQRTRLYACFVDLRKAFDTVSRDLLLHKIANLGICGNFFDVISDMYNNVPGNNVEGSGNTQGGISDSIAWKLTFPQNMTSPLLLKKHVPI